MSSQNITKVLQNENIIKHLEENDSLLQYTSQEIVPYIINLNSQSIYENIDSFLPNLNNVSFEECMLEMNQNVESFISDDTIDLIEGLSTLLSDVSLSTDDKIEVLNDAMNDFQVELEDVGEYYDSVSGAVKNVYGKAVGYTSDAVAKYHDKVIGKVAPVDPIAQTHAAASASPAANLSVLDAAKQHFAATQHSAQQFAGHVKHKVGELSTQAGETAQHLQARAKEGMSQAADAAHNLQSKASAGLSQAADATHRGAMSLGSHLNPTSNHSYDAMIGGGAGALALGAGALAARHIYKKMKAKKEG